MPQDISLLDLVKLDDLQRLIDLAWETASLPARLVDEGGNVLYASAGWSSWPHIPQPTQTLASYTDRQDQLGELRLAGGLRQVWLPFRVHNVNIAWIVLGEFSYSEETIRLTDLKELSNQSGLTLEECRARLNEVPHISQVKLTSFTETFRWQVNFVSNLADSTLEIRHQLEERKQAQAALSEMEKRYQSIFNGVQDGILVETSDGDILDVNEPACQMYGYTREEFLRLNLRILVAPGHPVIYLAPEAGTFSSPSRSMNLRKDGSAFPVELSGRRWEIEGQVLTLVVVRDVTQRDQAEKATNLARERLELALDATSAGLWDYDIPRRLNYSNQRWFSMLGYQEDEIPNPTESWQVLIHPDDRNRVITIYEQYLAGQRSNYDIEFRMRCKDGSWLWVQSRGRIVQRSPEGKPLRVVGTHIDISVRKAAEAALRASEEKFYKSFQTSPDAIHIVRLSDMQYLDINHGFVRLTGYAPEDIVGKTVHDLSVWVDPAQFEHMLAELTRKQEVLGMEMSFRRKDGTIGTGLIAARSFELEKEACFLGIIRDITDRKRDEELLQDAHLRLEWAYEATLLGWNRALEMKDVATKRHSDRCIDRTLDLARAAGLNDEEELRMIKYGAILHDIGKLAIPDKILNKPDTLTAEEWALMRRHPLYAREMLQGIEYLEPVLPLITNHHEHWDGSGYPSGLEGEEIPLSARIFAIVDVYDSITHERPWRPLQSESEALDYIRSNSGQHFDPRLVKLFLALIAAEKKH